MLNELVNETNQDSPANRVRKVLREGMDIYQEQFESRYPSLGKLFEGDERDQFVGASTAIVLRNQEQYLEQMKSKYGESTLTQNLGDLSCRVVDVVRVFFPNLIANLVAELQPLNGPNGDVLVIKPKYTNTAAGVTAGDEVFKQQTDGTYASDEQTNETVGTGDGTTTNFTTTLSLRPIRGTTVEVYVDGNMVGTDDGSGNLTGSGISTGTVNYETGAFDVTLSSAPASGSTIRVNYRWNYEANPDGIRELEVSVNLVPMSAKPHPLRVSWSVESQLTAMAAYNLDVEDTVSNIAAHAIKKERDYLLTRMINTAATVDSALDFDAAVPASGGITKTAHFQDWSLKLAYAESQIFAANGRGRVDYVLAGVNAADVISRQATFIPDAQPIPIGAHKIGTLGGTVDVIKDPTLSANTYIFGFRGMQPGDAAIILGEWIPIYWTPTFQNSNLTNSRGLLSMYDVLVNNASFFVKGTMTNYAA